MTDDPRKTESWRWPRYVDGRVKETGLPVSRASSTATLPGEPPSRQRYARRGRPVLHRPVGPVTECPASGFHSVIHVRWAAGRGASSRPVAGSVTVSLSPPAAGLRTTDVIH